MSKVDDAVAHLLKGHDVPDFKHPLVRAASAIITHVDDFGAASALPGGSTGADGLVMAFYYGGEGGADLCLHCVARTLRELADSVEEDARMIEYAEAGCEVH